MTGQDDKQPMHMEDSLVVTQTAYPSADILAEIGRVTVAAARVDRQKALALGEFTDEQRPLLELLRKNSADLCGELQGKLRTELEGSSLLPAARADLKTAYNAIKQRHRIIHSIWSLSADAAQVAVRDIADAANEEEIGRLLVRDVDAPKSWSTLHPHGGGPGIEKLAELRRVRAHLEASNLQLRNLRAELRERRQRVGGASAEPSARIRRFAIQYEEIDASLALLRSARDIMSSYRTALQDSDALLATLSIGIEKMLKLIYGFIIEDETGSWPTKAVLAGQTGFRHDVLNLDRACRKKLRERSALATSGHYFLSVLDDRDADQLIDKMLGVLAYYGTDGRFALLDQLGDRPPVADKSPQRQWEAYDRQVMLTEPKLPVGTIPTDEYMEFVRTPANLRHVEILKRWREPYYWAAMHKVLPEQARLFTMQLAPDTFD